MTFEQVEQDYIEMIERGYSSCIIKENDGWSLAITRKCVEYQLSYNYNDIYIFTLLSY
jgi:hypothetical protein